MMDSFSDMQFLARCSLLAHITDQLRKLQSMFFSHINTYMRLLNDDIIIPKAAAQQQQQSQQRATHINMEIIADKFVSLELSLLL